MDKEAEMPKNPFWEAIRSHRAEMCARWREPWQRDFIRNLEAALDANREAVLVGLVPQGFNIQPAAWWTSLQEKDYYPVIRLAKWLVEEQGIPQSSFRIKRDGLNDSINGTTNVVLDLAGA